VSATKRKHIVWVLSNASSAPYFNWFAEVAAQRKDFDMSFVCMYHEEPKMVRDMERYGFKCHWIKYDWHKRKTGLISTYFKLKRLFREIQPDVVHAHLFDDALAAITAAKAVGVPVRIATKGDASYHYFHNPQYVRFDKLINAKSTTIIALSSESREFIIANEEAAPDKVKLVHHGLNIAEVATQDKNTIESFRKQWNLERKTVIGTVSRFIPWKGYTDILEVIKHVSAVNINVRFLFCGSGEQESVIRQRVQDMGIGEFIVFTGSIPPGKMASLYGTMNVFLHAAHYEPFGLVIAEAMLNGIPVVSTRTGAAADAVISGEHGYLCEYGSTQTLADSILKLTDAETARKMGQNCIARATEMFAIETGYQNHLKIYQQD
jgi:glycosyltransferase involved in cell wall biosynthesis